MAIYTMGGTLLEKAYTAGGTELPAAYNISGTQIFPEGQHLRVCNYNVGQWYLGTKDNVPANLDEAYYALQNGMISSIDADILCLEEYWDQFSKAGRTAVSMLGQYYDYIETKNGSANDYYGRAICSKYPILSYTSNNYTVDALRYFDEAKVSIEGTDVYVFVTHLSSSSSTYRAQQATELLEFIEANNKMPYIICGDFNSNLKDPMSEYNIAVFQQYLDAGCSLANDGNFGLFKTFCETSDWSEATAIDNIIFSDIFTITSVATDLTKTTDSIVAKIDHVPLYANIVMAQ